MSEVPSNLEALGAQFARPAREWRNRLHARRASRGSTPVRAEKLPASVQIGDAQLGETLVGGEWQVLGHHITLEGRTIWEARLPEQRLEAERQTFAWLDHLAALGNRSAREMAQAWTQEWIRRYGAGGGPGWSPEQAGLRAMRWTEHCAWLVDGAEPAMSERFWRGLGAQQSYLANCWGDAAPGLARMRALAGLVWSGVALPHAGHRIAVTELGLHCNEVIDPEGETPSRAPQALAEAMMLLIWTARMLENAGQFAAPAHLAAIVRAVPMLRPLRLGDGTLARFHGGGSGSPDRIDQALAELRTGVHQKPALSMGYARLSGGRIVVILDAAKPPGGVHAVRAHASTLAFEMSVGRQQVVVSAGPGAAFGAASELISRQTSSHSALEVAGASSAEFSSGDLAARVFGPRLSAGPSLASVRQAQDATGQWLLATHDGYAASHGLLHERRVFVDARGGELRGEDILTVPGAAARERFLNRAYDGTLSVIVRFHLHADVIAEIDPTGD